MESIFAILKYLVFGFFGLIALLVVVVLVFGKRIKKKWDFEAEFRDASGRKFGEFDIEMSRIEKEEPDHTFKAKFRMRHDSMQLHQTVQVYLDDTLIVEGMVSEAGKVFLGKENIRNQVDEARVGQQCRVIVAGQELFSEPLKPD